MDVSLKFDRRKVTSFRRYLRYRPVAIVIVGRNSPLEYVPAPAIHHVGERQEGDLVETFRVEIVQQCFLIGRIVLQQTDLLEVAGRGRAERDDVADRLVKTGICAFLVHSGLILVLQIVLDVTHLMVRRQQILHVDTRALLDPEVLTVVELPRARMTDHLHVLLLLQD